MLDGQKLIIYLRTRNIKININKNNGYATKQNKHTKIVNFVLRLQLENYKNNGKITLIF